MRHYGKISLGNILHNLPTDCQEKMASISEDGWNCAFYLSVFRGKMHYGMAAENGDKQRVVCTTEIETAIDILFTKTVGELS